MVRPPAVVTALLHWVPSLSDNLVHPAGVLGRTLGEFLCPTVNAGMVRLAWTTCAWRRESGSWKLAALPASG